MAKKEKNERKKKYNLTEREEALIAESSGQKKYKRKDTIISVVITIIIVVVLVAGSTVAAMFLGKRLKPSDVYSYTEVTTYLESKDVEYTATSDLTSQPDGAVASIVVGDMEIRYINGGSFKIANDFYIGVDNVIESFNHKACSKDDARDYVIIGTDSAEYAEYFKSLVE